MRRTGALDAAHDAFVATRRRAPVDRVVRLLVLESWRSLLGGHDPDTMLTPFILDTGELADLRDSHPVGPVLPVIRQLLVTRPTAPA